jgi:hypothetical protein
MSVPITVRRATSAVFVVAAVHVLALTLLVINRHALVVAVADQHPDWTATRVQTLADDRFVQSVVPHVILAIALTIRALAVRRGRTRGRGFLTVVLVLQLAAHATFPFQAQMLPTFVGWLLLVQGISLVFEVSALWLLWRPEASRRWFGEAPHAARALS